MFKKPALIAALLAAAVVSPAMAKPETLNIDQGHTFITFEVSHIGFAWMPGLFSDFKGDLVFDPENKANSKVNFTVQVPSLTTFHAERDKHLKGEDFFDAGKFGTATFKSTSYTPKGDNKAELKGDLTIKGITKPVTFQVTELAGREDPWGNFRRAFEAETDLKLADFKLDHLGATPESATVRIALEAIRK